jgi:hypothetical protein
MACTPSCPHADPRMQFLSSLEHSAFGTWVREAPTIWAYATILFLHTVGLGFVVGVNVAIDLRILGVARQMPLAPMRKLFPWMWAGFIVNALSGIALLIADATTKLANPVFLVKMAFIALGVINMGWSKRKLFDDPAALEQFPPTAHAKRVAIVSLVLWIGATTAGRLMGYLGPVSGLESLD